MIEGPRWYGTLANVFAVALSVWVGLHYRAPEWVAIYAAAALASALLPVHKWLGVVGLVVAFAVAGGGFYLLRGAHFKLGDIVAGAGGPTAPPREVCVMALASGWLVLGSMYRLTRA